MNQYTKLLVVGWAILALPLNDVMARGGRGGAGTRQAGGARPGGRPGGHTTQAQLQSFLNLSGGAKAAGAAAGVAAGAHHAGGNSAVNDFLHSSSGSPASRGTVAGITEQTQSIEGMVDQESQRAAWVIGDRNTPILETGISNLTQNEASVLVHFENGQTQQWLMVRIDNPEAETQTK